MYFDWPEFSPWGKIQHCEVLCNGAFEVSTASHGGVMVRKEIEKILLSPAARKCGFQENGYRCFEEDCDAPVALLELIEAGRTKAREAPYFQPGEFARLLKESIQRYHPDYWNAHEIAAAKVAGTDFPQKQCKMQGFQER